MPEKETYKCGQEVFILNDASKIEKVRLNAVTKHERWDNNAGKVNTKMEYKVDGVERFVQPDVDFFATKDDLIKSLGV